MTMQPFKLLIKLVLFTLFLWTCFMSFSKYSQRRKSSDIKLKDVITVQYPSVTICPEYTFKTYIDDDIIDGTNFDEVKQKITKNVWKLNESVYFIDHPHNGSDGFPCMTTMKSVDPGKPCSFPFIYDYKSTYSEEKLSKLKNTYCNI